MYDAHYTYSGDERAYFECVNYTKYDIQCHMVFDVRMVTSRMTRLMDK